MIISKNFQSKNLRLIYLLTMIACIGVLLGRGWQHIFWDPPYRTLLWDENLFKPVIEKVFGIPWEKYVTSIRIDHNFQTSFKIIGFLLVLGIFFTFFLNRIKRVAENYLLICTGWLFILSIIYWKEYFWDFPQFAELCSQWMAPAIFVGLNRSHERNIDMIKILKITLALTFFGHGLYALGLVPIPGQWIDMVINALNISETNSKYFLKAVGVLDIIASVLVFFPKFRKYGYWYMAIWGACAAIGRLVGTYYSEIGFFNFLHQQAGEFLYRIPQFLLPIVALLILKELKIFKAQQASISTQTNFQ
jgi:hypothetical protein